jgi:DNA replication protein DnaC
MWEHKHAATEAEKSRAVRLIDATANAAEIAAPTPQPRPVRSWHRVAAWTEQQKRSHDEKISRLQQEDQEHAKAEHIARLKTVASVPDHYADASLDDVRDVPAEYRSNYARTVERVKRILEEPGMLVLLGTRGSGKTHIACAAVNAMCARREPALYRRAHDLYVELRSSYRAQGGPSEAAIIRRASTTRLLVIDEIQVASGSEWETNTLTSIIDARYANDRPAILISNLQPSEFAARVGDSIASRLAEVGEIIVCNWGSLRGRKQ